MTYVKPRQTKLEAAGTHGQTRRQGRAGNGREFRNRPGDFRATAGSSPYIASKGGVLMLMKTAALDYANSNIRVNAVCPGLTRTAILDSLNAEQLVDLEQRSPLGRMNTPEEVAALSLFLASDDSVGITGSSYIIDGGRCAG
jgi:meso-butanediol dehydrogenase/(S,S)-butanediol dehydrogenase/diacetyl reductase